MKKFYRSTTNKVIAGVCGGLGEYFTIDPTIVRIIFVLLLLGTGIFPFGIAYLLMAWFVPKKPPHDVISDQ